MNANDIRRMLSHNGNSHSFSKSMNRVFHSRSSRSGRSLPSLSKRSARGTASTGLALPLLLGIGAAALIGAGVDLIMRRNSGQGIKGRLMGSESLKYRPVHGTAGAEMPQPQGNA